MFNWYLSFVYLLENQESKFQIMLRYKRSENPTVERVNYNLKELYFDYLIQPIPSASIDFLDYQYSKYEGRKTDFLHFVTETLTPENIDTYVLAGESGRIITNSSIVTISDLGIDKAIIDWLDDKKRKVVKRSRATIKSGHKPFNKYITNADFPLSENDQMAIVSLLKESFSGKRGKTIAFMIIALKNKNYINFKKGDKTHLYSAIAAEFGKIGTDQSINKYVDIDPFKTGHQLAFNRIATEIDGIITQIIK